MTLGPLAGLDPGEAVRDTPQRRSPVDRLSHALAGVLLAIAWIYVGQRHRLSTTPMLIPRLAIGYLFSVLVHEGGHAAAAALQRFHIYGFAVWPVWIHRNSSAWRIGWAPRKGPRGFVTIVPVGAGHLRIRQFVVVAAGPLASALAAAGCWSALNAMGNQPTWLLDQFLIIALWSALFAAGGLLPVGSGAAISDGARLRMLIRGGAEWDRVRAQQLIVAASMNGQRPREWQSGLIAMAAGPEDGSPAARSGRALRYNWLVDQGRIDEAEQQIAWLLLQPWPEAELRQWRLEAAWFAAFFRDDATTARKWFDAGRNGTAPPDDYTYAMAEAALACAERRWTDTVRLVPGALEECERLTDRGAAEALRDALSILMSRVESFPPTSQTPN